MLLVGRSLELGGGKECRAQGFYSLARPNSPGQLHAHDRGMPGQAIPYTEPSLWARPLWEFR
jgi:hypothetical protein